MKCIYCESDKLLNKKNKVINDITYTIKVCVDCFYQKFPELIGKPLTSWSMNKYVKYAYNIDDNEYINLSKKYNGRTLEYFINKYGYDEGNKRWESYKHKQAISNSFEYKKNKYNWTFNDFKNFNKSRAVTKDNLINMEKK